MTNTQANPGRLEIAEPLIIISIGKSYRKGQSVAEIYDGVRKWWPINPHKAAKYQLVLARYRDRIVGAYRPTVWAPDNLFIPRKYGFAGKPAEFYAWRFYVGKWVPHEFRKPGAAFPIRYCDEVEKRW